MKIDWIHIKWETLDYLDNEIKELENLLDILKKEYKLKDKLQK